MLTHKTKFISTAQDYYPFGMLMPMRNFSSGKYRLGFNGKENDNEVKGNGNSLDFGARIYDSRFARWQSVDKLSSEYPGHSPYNFVLNTPLNAVDPDGNLVIFINGFRRGIEAGDQTGYGEDTRSQIYFDDVFDYWGTESNSFGRESCMDERFMERIRDFNAVYLSGSSNKRSSATQRINEGKIKALLFHNYVKHGLINIAKGETIKIISHSQGGAHALGFALTLIDLGYNIEVMYFITPHQPTYFAKAKGVFSVQYSHPNDGVASTDPWWLPNGSSRFGRISGVDQFDGRTIMGNDNQIPATGLWTFKHNPKGLYGLSLELGNRNGHNITDNDFIFDIPEGKDGYVAPRKDKNVAPVENNRIIIGK